MPAREVIGLPSPLNRSFTFGAVDLAMYGAPTAEQVISGVEAMGLHRWPGSELGESGVAEGVFWDELRSE